MNNVYKDHPIFDPILFRIWTPHIIMLQESITKLVWLGATGAVVVGFSRAGKTSAFEMIKSNILDRAGNKVPVVVYSVHRRDCKTIKQLYKHIFSKLKLDFKRNDDYEDFADKLCMHLAEMANNTNSKSVVFAVDEAQRLSIAQLDLFAELCDVLAQEYSLLLTVIFVGNREQLKRLLDKITNGENEHIEGRFFRRKIEFHGLESLSDVEYCLEQYDKYSSPYSDNPCCTECFLPEAYADGFRMKSLSTSIWRVFSEYRKDLHIREWGMEYFIISTKLLLTDYLPRIGVDSYSDDVFRQCIELSNLVSDLAKPVKSHD